MKFQFLLMGKRVLTGPELPEGMRHLAPLPVMDLTTFGVVDEEELPEKLRYFRRGVSPEFQGQIYVCRYPESWPMLSLHDMCQALGID